MARQTVVAQTLPGAYPTLPIGAGTRHLTMTAVDDQTDRSTPLVDNKTVLYLYNQDASPHTVTITSAADTPFNRTGDITNYSVPAGEVHVFGPFKSAGWAVGGLLLWDVSDPLLRSAVVTNP